MRKICYIIGTLEIGGAEKQLLELCQALDKSRFCPVVIALRRGGPLKRDFEEHGIRVLEAGKKHKIDLLFLFRLLGILRKEKPAMVHTFMFTSNTWGRLAAVLAGVPVIFSSERCVDPWKRWYHRLIDRFLLKFTKKVVANSQAVKHFYVRLERIPPGKIEVIPNGIETERFAGISISLDKKKTLGLEKAGFIIGCGGRFTPQKGLVYLVRAIPAVLAVFPDAYFVFVGDGPLREELELLTRRLGVADHVVFTGYRNDIHEIFACADIIAVPSLFEGMPNIVLEAMALKKPVLGSDIPEIAELITEGKNGLLVPVRDARALGEKIVFLLENPELARSMGVKGYELVKSKFSVREMVQRYEGLYESARNKGTGTCRSQSPGAQIPACCPPE